MSKKPNKFLDEGEGIVIRRPGGKVVKPSEPKGKKDKDEKGTKGKRRKASAENVARRALSQDD